MAMSARFATRALKVGAEVTGLDLRALIHEGASSSSVMHEGASSSSVIHEGASSSLAAQLREALDEHGLLLLRGQHLKPDDHVQCAEWFGPVFQLPLRFQHRKSPFPLDILRMSNDATEGYVGVGTSGWHIDGTSYEKPFQLALMHIIHSPQSPAPTLFMPLGPLASRIRHHAPSWDRLWVRNGKGTHPLLYAHPRTGMPGVCLGKVHHFVWDQGEPEQRVADEEETTATLADLHAHAEAFASDHRVYRHEWRAGDLILVDNLAVAHLASMETQLPREEAGLRVLHRIVVAGVDLLTPLHQTEQCGRMAELFTKQAPPGAQRLAARALSDWPEWRCEAYPASAAGRFQESRWWEASGRHVRGPDRIGTHARRPSTSEPWVIDGFVGSVLLRRKSWSRVSFW